MRLVRALALLGGVLLPGLETWRRWGTDIWLPSLIDDWIIGALLLVAWWFTRGVIDVRGRAWMAAAWGFASAMGFVSFFGQLREAGIGTAQSAALISSRDVSGLSHTPVILFKGIATLLAILALSITLAGARSATHGNPARHGATS